MPHDSRTFDSDVAQRLYQQLQEHQDLQRKAFARLQTLLNSPDAAATDLDHAQRAWEAAKVEKWVTYDAFEASLKQLDPSFLTRAERRSRRPRRQ